MPVRKSGKKGKNQQIFEEQLQSGNQQHQSVQKIEKMQDHIKAMSSHEEQEEGQILDQEDEYSRQDNLQPRESQLQALNKNNQVYQDSSDEDNDRLQKERKKREQLWKQKNQKNQQIQGKQPLTQAQLLEAAFAALEKSNKKVMLIRKKNEKRMEDLQKIRMAQQPYLTTGNTHFRGSSSEYSIITHDSTGKTYYHPNHSFRVGEMKLQNFILKNIKQQSTANYLNEVVKFQNYAYQQRKKRRHNIQ